MKTSKNSTLTQRQQQILELLSKGRQNIEIADELVPPITEGSVKQHLYKIYRKLEVKNRLEAVKRYRDKRANMK